ncbi:hypothetical protein LXJ15735_34890 [Lacrimispora xylanolytica]|nr:hypothetical protein [Clostridiales bacterium]
MNLSQRRPMTDEEAAEMLSCMEQAERGGMFDNLFCREQVVIEVPASRERLLQSISPDMKLTKGFFRKIYGYELSFPGFWEQAINTLEAAGCTMARVYYDDIIGGYLKGTEEILKPVAVSYLKECDQKWEQRQKRGEDKRKQQKIQDLLQMSDRELLSLLQSMN